MTKKPASLTAHKSQIERRRKKEVRSEMVNTARGMASSNDVVAYAIVALTSDGRAFADWDTGGIIPMWAFPSAVREVLAQDMDHSGVEEDFRKPVIDRAWKGSK